MAKSWSWHVAQSEYSWQRNRSSTSCPGPTSNTDYHIQLGECYEFSHYDFRQSHFCDENIYVCQIYRKSRLITSITLTMLIIMWKSILRTTIHRGRAQLLQLWHQKAKTSTRNLWSSKQNQKMNGRNKFWNDRNKCFECLKN